jgi:uncharacterized protein YjiK
MLSNKNISPWLTVFFLIFVSCNNNTAQYKGPAGYDINNPVKFAMPNSLHEISGISFLNDVTDSICAIEDEDGKLFYFTLGSEKINNSKFSKKGDFEDVAILNKNTVAVLKSNGSLFVFGTGEIGKEKIDSAKEYDNILPAGEYEGLSSDAGKLFALCKNCMDDNEKKEVSVYTLQPNDSGVLAVSGSLKIDLSPLKSEEKKIKGKFHPSCIAKNPVTNEWYIISSVNKLLLVLDEQWKIKESFPLNPSLFKQPEGMTFNAKGDLYISNEGGDGTANILLFSYKK